MIDLSFGVTMVQLGLVARWAWAAALLGVVASAERSMLNELNLATITNLNEQRVQSERVKRHTSFWSSPTLPLLFKVGSPRWSSFTQQGGIE